IAQGRREPAGSLFEPVERLGMVLLKQRYKNQSHVGVAERWFRRDGLFGQLSRGSGVVGFQLKIRSDHIQVRIAAYRFFNYIHIGKGGREVSLVYVVNNRESFDTGIIRKKGPKVVNGRLVHVSAHGLGGD